MDKLDLIKAWFVMEGSTVVWGPADGRFYSSEAFWLRHRREREGKPVPFYRTKAGYDVIKVNMVGCKPISFPAHVIVWTLNRGRLPARWLDHIDGNPANNALCNLREADARQNARNATRRKEGLKGAYLRGGRWTSSVWREGKLEHLGSFASAEEAHDAWKAANRETHGAFFNDGKPHVDVFG